MSTAELNEAAAHVASGLRRSSLAPVGLAFLTASLDLPVFAITLWFAQYAATPLMAFEPLPAAGWSAAFSGAAILLLVAGDGYAPHAMTTPLRAALQAFGALGAPLLLGVAMKTMPGAHPSDLAIAFVVAASVAILPLRLTEAFLVRWIIDLGLVQRRAVIAGGGDHAERLIRGLAQRPRSDVCLYGIFDDRDDVRSPLQILGIPKIGRYEDLIGFVRRSEVDMVIVALPLEAEERINWLLDTLKVLPVEVRLSAFSQDYAFLRPDRDPLLSVIRRTFAPERRMIKRAFDITFASLALLVVWPVMVAAALVIWLETGGPILFVQRRHGYNHRVIEVLKFRSMHARSADPEARRVVTRGDPRVTRVGRFLRRTSIDELPQLFNVLNGTLSLVGPRPHAIDALSSTQERFSHLVEGYSSRHRLPPGITGWAQIHGWRGEIDDPEKLRARFEHDLYYIENWSLLLDLIILVRTPLSLLNSRGAY